MFEEIRNEFDNDQGYVQVSYDSKKKIKMSVKKQEGQKVITMKMEAERMEVNLFNLVAMIYEVDLYTSWFPFCKKSLNV